MSGTADGTLDADDSLVTAGIAGNGLELADTIRARVPFPRDAHAGFTATTVLPAG